jgi:hypothetical protein
METEEEKQAREAEELKTKEAEELAAHTAEEGLKTPEEIAEEAERLLADGTPKDKTIIVKKDKFDDRNEKAKLYETHASLLDRVLKDPALVEKLLETESKDNVEGRLERLEAERKAEKRGEMKRVISEALTRWPNFEKSWLEVNPIMESLVKQGYSYQDAMQRAYIAVHPEVANAESERMNREGLNREGTFSGGGHPPRTDRINAQSKLSEDEKKVAQALGKSEEDYAKLLEKHKDWIGTNIGL